MLAVKEQAKQGVQIHSIDLKPLGAPQVAELVADALHQDVATATPLAEIVAQKTGGNPFFMRQFLHALYASKLIYFRCRSEGVFRYDAAAVKSAAITENVAEFLAAKIEKLPRATRDVLRVAAAIGNRFELRVLAGVEHRSAAETAAHLRPALEDGLIVPHVGARERRTMKALESPLVYARFAFLHDRVQQAAYATLSAAEQARATPRHRSRPARERARGAARGAPVRYRQSLESGDRADRGRRTSGGGSRSSTCGPARKRGIRRHTISRSAASGTHWRSSASTLGETTTRSCATLHKRLAESAWPHGGLSRCVRVIDAALEHATSIIDRANLFTIKTNVLLIMGRIPEALACGRQAARMFDVDLPEDSERVRALLQREIEVILERTAAIGIDKLLDLPAMKDGGKIALMALAYALPARRLSDRSRLLRAAHMHDGSAVVASSATARCRRVPMGRSRR